MKFRIVPVVASGKIQHQVERSRFGLLWKPVATEPTFLQATERVLSLRVEAEHGGIAPWKKAAA